MRDARRAYTPACEGAGERRASPRLGQRVRQPRRGARKAGRPRGGDPQLRDGGEDGGGEPRSVARDLQGEPGPRARPDAVRPAPYRHSRLQVPAFVMIMVWAQPVTSSNWFSPVMSQDAGSSL